MHISASFSRPPAATYRERLSPSLWVLVSAALCAPMAALVFVPLNTTVALIVGALVGIAVVGSLVLASPSLELTGTTLRVGRAHIDVADLGVPTALTGDQARQARGPALAGGAWHLLRGGFDAVVHVPVIDPEDPTPEWVFSTRTPDRVVAAIRRAQSRGDYAHSMQTAPAGVS